MRFLFFFVLLIFSASLNGQGYISPEGDTVSTRAYASVGLFFPNLTTSLRVDSKNGLGTDLGLEDDFNFDERIAVFYAQAVVRVKNRSQFVLAFENMSRNSSLEIDRDIEIGDTSFYIGARLDLKFDVNYYALTWRYSFFNHPNWNAGVSFGLRAAEFVVKADATFNGSEYGESSSVIAPSVLFGLHGSGYLTDRLLARYSIEYFALSVEDLTINVLETRASLEYFILKNVGVGAAYSTSQYVVEDFPLSNDFEGRVLFDFSGGNLFLSARF
ncbi:hypothetical protein O3Q51_00215 [Cryomorphaceae bacterium 1068]|nr:hypothetical protein [Cryomorphaceae bacterium 1068]